MKRNQSYEPTPALRSALKAWRDTVMAEETARKHLRAAVAYDMAQYDVSNSEMAEHLPWTSETVRVIGKENGVRPGRRRAHRSVKKKLEESA